MKNKTQKILGLVILITGLALGLMPKAGFAACDANIPAAPHLANPTVDYGGQPTPSSLTKITLTWNDTIGTDCSNGCGYRVEWKKGTFGAWSILAYVAGNQSTYPWTLPATFYTHNIGIQADTTTTQYYRIKAYRIGPYSSCSADSDYSNEVAVTTPGAGIPSAPSGLTASAVSSSQINLSWIDNSNNETYFYVFRSSPQLGQFTFIGSTRTNVNMYEDKNLTPNTTYYYIVRSVIVNPNATVTYSADSNIASAKTQQSCKKIVYVHGAGEFRPWGDCLSSAEPCFEIKTFEWGRSSDKPGYADAGQKELPAFGDDLNQYMIDNNIFDGSEVTILAHSFGNLIVRQAMIRAKDRGLLNSAKLPLYSNVHFVQVAPMIGGDYWAGNSPLDVATLFSKEVKNLNPDGEIQQGLYDDAARAKLKVEIGTGKIDIVLGGADTTAAPARRQLFNKWLAEGLKEGKGGAPIIVDGRTHDDVLDSNEVCALISGQGEIPATKPAIFVKDAKTTLSGELILTLYNVGAPAKNVHAYAKSLNSKISITKNASGFGDLGKEEFLGTGESKDNSKDPFIIAIPSGTPNWFFAPEVEFTITYDGSPSPPDKRTCHVVIKPLTVSNRRILSSNSLLPRTINFAKKIFERILSLERNIAIAQESSSGAQQLNAHPVLADLDKDGKKEVIIPLAGRKLYVLKSDGTDFWPVPYVITDSGCTALYPVVADINNDGELEIIIAEYGADVLRILDKNGTLLCFVSGVKVGMPAVADIDNSGDGKMEIVVAKEGELSLLNSDGSILWTKSDLTGYTPQASAPVLIDLNQDGKKEIITGDVCVLDKDGKILSKKTALGERGVSVADIDNDGKPEIISGRIFKFADNNPADILTQWSTLYEYIPEYPPQIADLDGDGELEVLTIEESGDLKIYYDISQSGSKTAEFSLPFFALQRSPIALYDMDKDNKLEIVLAANSVSTGALYLLGFLDSQVELIDTFDTDYRITHTPVIADMNKDNIIELVAADLTSESENRMNYLAIGDSSQGTIFWPQFQRDTLRTGLYDIQPPQLSAIGNKTVNGGQQLSFTISATDQLVNKLSFSAYPLPQGAKLINNGNGSATFSWTPTFFQGGAYNLTFAVSDGALTSSEGISVTVNSDTTAPTKPVVTDQGTSTLSLNNLSASWNSSDPQSGISEYQYRITEGSTAGAVVRDWTSTATASSVTATGLSLKDGKSYYFAVKAKNGAGLWSIVGYSDGIAVTPVIGWDIKWGFQGTIPVSGDFDGDGKSDLAVYHPATGAWYIRTVSGTILAWNLNPGFYGGVPVPGDYYGDRKSDLTVFRSGMWYIGNLSIPIISYPLPNGDIPVSGDYDGCGKTDFAVYNSGTGRWFIKKLFVSAPLAWDLSWGFKGAIPVSGDYDGDGKADLAVYHSAAGNWYIRSLIGNVLAWAVNWGFSAAIPVSGDYNGDGRADLAVYDTLNGKWYIRSLIGNVLAWGLQHGFKGAIPVSGDYDGDGKADLAVYYPATGKWYIRVIR